MKATSPLIIAHRGAAGDAPENTMAAFELALRQGTEAIELDVHLSADAVPVVIHDPRLERTTSGSGLVRTHSAAALRRLDAGSWFNRRHPGKARASYAGLRIPLLAEVLDRVREHRCRAFVEIKMGSAIYPGIEKKVLEEIHRARVAPLTTVMSLDLRVVRRVRQLDSRIALGATLSRPLPPLRRATAVAARTILTHWAFASPLFIRRVHRSGLQVAIWTVNQPRWMRRKILDGVDGIITDFPARLGEIRAHVRGEKGDYRSS